MSKFKIGDKVGVQTEGKGYVGRVLMQRPLGCYEIALELNNELDNITAHESEMVLINRTLPEGKPNPVRAYLTGEQLKLFAEMGTIVTGCEDKMVFINIPQWFKVSQKDLYKRGIPTSSYEMLDEDQLPYCVRQHIKK